VYDRTPRSVHVVVKHEAALPGLPAVIYWPTFCVTAFTVFQKDERLRPTSRYRAVMRTNWEDGFMESGKKRGFTLIELLVVVALLVILAGTILPKLDRVQLKANKGVAANNAGGVSRYIQTYRVMHNLYPDRWDSLLTSGSGGLWMDNTPATDATTVPQLEPQLTGAIAGGPTKLTTLTLTLDEQIRSLARMGIGNVLDLDGLSTGIPGNRFTQVRALAVGDKVATINGADGDGQAIIDNIYPENRLSTGTPGTIPSGKRLVVFGFGPGNAAIGDIVQECPFYSNTDPALYYHRFLAVFEISDGGSRAELKAVLGADGDRIDEEINDYYEK
jgi:prepilin-type N-terminal cleavage/methylation domain-containing protein